MKRQGKQRLEAAERKIKRANDSKSVFRAEASRKRRRYSAMPSQAGFLLLVFPQVSVAFSTQTRLNS